MSKTIQFKGKDGEKIYPVVPGQLYGAISQSNSNVKIKVDNYTFTLAYGVYGGNAFCQVLYTWANYNVNKMDLFGNVNLPIKTFNGYWTCQIPTGSLVTFISRHRIEYL